ncbi:hypothetical protein POZ12_09085, partial [Bacteroides uniformis]|nr:hypothetical protein [Bacteroides uniformis]MDC1863740.1 hypothetical protein [Bacteroides uniformis]MDC1868219.1 hypothetical protein [Bacteroides uniformis]
STTFQEPSTDIGYKKKKRLAKSGKDIYHSFSPNTSSIRPKQMVCLPQTHDVCCGNFIRS